MINGWQYFPALHSPVSSPKGGVSVLRLRIEHRSRNVVKLNGGASAWQCPWGPPNLPTYLEGSRGKVPPSGTICPHLSEREIIERREKQSLPSWPQLDCYFKFNL